MEEAGLEPRDLEKPGEPFARQLTREALRYLYRILFLLYAEARPELGILPADDGTYEAYYSVARLREIVERDAQLTDETARNGTHLHDSLDLLFNKVNYGHREYGTEPWDELDSDDAETRKKKAKQRSEGRGLRFEPLRSELFEPAAVTLIGRGTLDPRRDEDSPEGPAWLDLRLRNSALHEVLRLLTMKKAKRRGERGGFISYRNLGINQLGAVYEGLMSYTGIIAEEKLCEVAKGGAPEKGSWLVPAHRLKEYDEKTWVLHDERDREEKGLRGPKEYLAGTFVYRLAYRDRETSASYYTPESLTKVTVELALKHRLDQEKDEAGNVVKTRASELLKYRICEPAARFRGVPQRGDQPGRRGVSAAAAGRVGPLDPDRAGADGEAEGQGVRRPAQRVRRRPEPDGRRAGRGLDVAQHHAPRDASAVVRAAPAARQLADRRAAGGIRGGGCRPA